MAVLEQDKITEIYTNPNLANEHIASYFPEIEPYDLTYIKKIIEISGKIKPLDKNYKSVTSILKILKNKTDYFSYDLYKTISSDNIRIKINSLSKDLNEITNEIKNIGLNVEKIEKENDKLLKLYAEYLYMIDSYAQIINSNNTRIQKIISEQDASKKIIQDQRKNLSSILKLINNNFYTILNAKKLEYLLNNFKPNNPLIKKYYKSPYLFTTSYEIPDNLIDLIFEKLTSTISKVKSDSGDFSLVLKYIDGERKLKTGVNNISAELSKFIRDEIFVPKKEFFKVNSKIDISNIEKKKDLINHIDRRNITDLSKESPGMKSVAYLDMLFDLNESILLFDQPEDNIDNDYISQTLVSIIKEKKKIKQLIFVTHNPTVAVYGDAFNYIFVTNNGEIEYKNYLIESQNDKEQIMNILDGGRKSFANRNKKYGNVLGEEEYGNN